MTLSFVTLSMGVLNSCGEKDVPIEETPGEEPPLVSPERNPLVGYYFDPSIGDQRGRLIHEISESYFVEHIFRGVYHYSYPCPAKYDLDKKMVAYYNIQNECYELLGIEKKDDELLLSSPYRRPNAYGSVFSEDILSQIIADYNEDYINWNSASAEIECDKETFKQYNMTGGIYSVNPMASLLIGKWCLLDTETDEIFNIEFKDHYAYSDSRYIGNGHCSADTHGVFSVTGLTLKLPESSIVAKYYGRECILKFDFAENTQLGQPGQATLKFSDECSLMIEKVE